MYHFYRSNEFHYRSCEIKSKSSFKGGRKRNVEITLVVERHSLFYLEGFNSI